MSNNQDFFKKITLVLREDLETWQVLNTVGHISAYFGNKMKDVLKELTKKFKLWK